MAVSLKAGTQSSDTTLAYSSRHFSLNIGSYALSGIDIAEMSAVVWSGGHYSTNSRTGGDVCQRDKKCFPQVQEAIGHIEVERQ